MMTFYNKDIFHVYFNIYVIKLWLIFFTSPLCMRFFLLPHSTLTNFSSYPAIFSSAPTEKIDTRTILIRAVAKIEPSVNGHEET